MSVTIFYYTGTGNSLWVARNLASVLKDAEPKPMLLDKPGPLNTASDTVGLVFPVHMWGLPARVIEFVKRLEADKGKYYFACAVNAGQVAATLVQLKKLMASKGITLGSGFDFVMPSNYIPWGGAPDTEKQNKLFEKAAEKIKRAAPLLERKALSAPEKGPLWQNIIFSAMLYPVSAPHIPKMDKSFFADDKCNGCGICARVCPAGNIALPGGRPAWQGPCEQCFACLQWCPKEAIQYGKKTSGYKRYHHPEIRISDMFVDEKKV